MGQVPIRPQATRKHVKELKEDFTKMSQEIETRLPWIALARDGAAMLFLAAPILLGLTGGSGLAAIVVLIVLALILHFTSYYLRQICCIRAFGHLLDKFQDIVPEYMDTSQIPKSQRDFETRESFALAALETASLAVVLEPINKMHVVLWVLMAFVLWGFTAGVSIYRILHSMNDFRLVVTCQMCVSILQKLQNTYEKADRELLEQRKLYVPNAVCVVSLGSLRFQPNHPRW